ncbi:MAG: hypothetical protein ACR2PL_22275 [Dehalococcoidia bacterium]
MANASGRHLYIALVGGQTAPTLLGLLREGRRSVANPQQPHYPSDVHLIHTRGSASELSTLMAALPQAGQKRLAGRATGSSGSADPRLDLGAHHCAVSTSEVDRDIPEETAEAVRRAIGGFAAERVTIDITGATKLMSAGAYLVALDLVERSPERAEILYVVSERHQYRLYHRGKTDACQQAIAGTHWCIIPFPAAFPELRLPSLAAAYGYTLAERLPASARQAARRTRLSASSLGALQTVYREQLRDQSTERIRLAGSMIAAPERFSTARELRRRVLSAKWGQRALTGYSSTKTSVQAFLAELEAAGLLTQRPDGYVAECPNTSNADQIEAVARFWEGTWLEDALFATLQELQQEDVDLITDIERNKDIQRAQGTGHPSPPPGAAAAGATISEVDVALLLSCHLVFFECKDWNLHPQAAAGGDELYKVKEMRDALIKVDSHRRRLGGFYSVAYLVVAQSMHREACEPCELIREECTRLEVRILEAEPQAHKEPLKERLRRELVELRTNGRIRTA